jgi:hypothetical protein
MDLTRDRFLLTTALVAAQLPETVPEARMLRAWADRASAALGVVGATGHSGRPQLSSWDVHQQV